MHHWHVLHTKPHQERLVAAQLRSRQLECWLPLLCVNPVNPRARRERPYFPGYVFLHADLDALDWAGLPWTPGLRRLVEFGGQPAIVPEDLIAEIRQRLDRIRLLGGETYADLQPGDAVRIVGGPLAGYAGIFDLRLSGLERVRVLLDLLQDTADGRRIRRLVPVELNAGLIARVQAKLQQG